MASPTWGAVGQLGAISPSGDWYFGMANGDVNRRFNRFNETAHGFVDQGGRRFRTEGSSGHSQYFDPGLGATSSLHSIAALITDQAP